MKTTRRQFLKLGASAGASISFMTSGLLSRPLHAAEGSEETVLVVLQLAGGNDALNTFIPYADSRYRSLRPQLSIHEGSMIPLDDRIALHPALEPLVPYWNDGSFSFVTNVGFPTLDRSHFHCEDVWQTADEHFGNAQHAPLGWLGRWADMEIGDTGSSVATLAIGRSTPLGLASSGLIPAVVSEPDQYDIQVDPRYPWIAPSLRGGLRSIYGNDDSGTHGPGAVRDRGREMFETIDLVAQLGEESVLVTYPESNLGEAFELAARMIGSGLGSRAIWIKTGGYDTHSGQAETHAELLEDVASSLAAFQEDLRQRGLSHRVVVMAWSEFGRRVSENASLGTDHGKAGSMFLLGDRIAGGQFHGNVPDLANLDNGDIRTDIDFRAVYATLIDDWLGGHSHDVLHGHYENLGFIRKTHARRRPIGR